MAHDALRHHRRLAHVQPRWILVDGAQRILGQTPDGLARFAERTLGRRGIEIITETRLTSVDADGIGLSDGRRIGTSTVVWTAGVTVNPIVSALGLPVDDRGRVEVDAMLRVTGSEHIWSLGDCAAVPNQATPGVTDPPTCQHALRQARRLSRNLRGTPRPYKFRSLGHMATLGRRHGIAVVAGLRLRGIAGWAFARGYHVLQLPFASRRARVLADWATAALFRRDLAELSIPRATAQEG